LSTFEYLQGLHDFLPFGVLWNLRVCDVMYLCSL